MPAVSKFGFPRDLPVLNSSAQGNGKNEEGGLENGKKFGGGGNIFIITRTLEGLLKLSFKVLSGETNHTYYTHEKVGWGGILNILDLIK